MLNHTVKPGPKTEVSESSKVVSERKLLSLASDCSTFVKLLCMLVEVEDRGSHARSTAFVERVPLVSIPWLLFPFCLLKAILWSSISYSFSTGNRSLQLFRIRRIEFCDSSTYFDYTR